jgi:hypothetical protein
LARPKNSRLEFQNSERLALFASTNLEVVRGNLEERGMAANVKIVQRNFEPGTSAIEALMLTVIYAQGVTAEVTIVLRPCTVPNDEASIRKEIERLGNALVEAARSPGSCSPKSCAISIAPSSSLGV